MVAKAARKVNKNIQVLAWNWGWAGRIESWDAMAAEIGDAGVRVMCTSEEGVQRTIGGVQTSVIDYSISLVAVSYTHLVFRWELITPTGKLYRKKIFMQTAFNLDILYLEQ